MKCLRHILWLLVSAAVVAGCQSSSTTVTTYSEALVTSLSFTKNDSIPGLEKASFTIVTATDTGLIYNKDSLLYGTRIDSVIPKFTFNHTPAYATFCSDSDTIVYTGVDTVNMNARPCRLYVMASDRKTEKWYNIFVNVHKIDPDLYKWECLTPSVYPAEGGQNKAFLINGTFYLFEGDEISVRLYTSSDAKTWSSATAINGLPGNCRVRNIMQSDRSLYYADGDKLYVSQNATDWTEEDYSDKPFRLLNMLYDFNDSVWCIAQRISDDKLCLANMAEGGTFALTGDTLPEEFPISDFGVVTFPSSSLRQRAMVMGGYDIDGNALNTRWNVEFVPNRGYRVVDFSVEQPYYKALTGISLLWYNHEFHLFGSSNADSEVSQQTQLVSTDEGMHWTLPDSTKNLLPYDEANPLPPASYRPRYNTSVMQDDGYYIYIIGGQSRTQTFSDVWRGRLNSTTFADYE